MGCLKLVENKSLELKIVSEKKSVRSEKTFKKGRSYLEARYYNPKISNWLSVDPPMMEGDYFEIDEEESINGGVLNSKNLGVYSYTYNNPITLRDSDGNWPTPDTVWDLANVGIGVASLISNVSDGNLGDAALDAGGIVLDVAAAAIPVIPGGAGTAIKTARTADKVADAVKAGDKVSDAKKVANGNSKASEKAQHVYEIVNKKTNKVEKVGISGGKVSKSGNSYRATSQVNKLNKSGGNYSSRIAEKIPAGKGAREKALNSEKKLAEHYKKTNQLNREIHQRP
jgi:RHS repeat-associated protein